LESFPQCGLLYPIFEITQFRLILTRINNEQ
jgi:hypothetical protein